MQYQVNVINRFTTDRCAQHSHKSTQWVNASKQNHTFAKRMSVYLRLSQNLMPTVALMSMI